jgi:hypothetical protein
MIAEEKPSRSRVKVRASCLRVPKKRQNDERQHLPDIGVNLAPLTRLVYISFRTHDLRLVCTSLSTLSTSFLQKLEVNYTTWESRPWRCACDCVLVEQISHFCEVVRRNDMLARTGIYLVLLKDYFPGQVSPPTMKGGCTGGNIEIVKRVGGRYHWKPDTRGALLPRIVARMSVGQSK